jgi:hypothetical protein
LARNRVFPRFEEEVMVGLGLTRAPSRPVRNAG